MLFLINLKLKILINRYKEKGLIENITFSILFLVVIALVFFVNIFIIKNYIKNSNFINTVNFLFIFLFVIGISKQIHNIYSLYFESDDKEILFCSPLKTESIILYKFIQSMFSSGLVFFIILLPYILCYGIVYGASNYYYVFCAIALLLLLSIISSFMQIFVSFIIRISPGAYKKETIYIVVGIFSFLSFFTIIFLLDNKHFLTIINNLKFFKYLLIPYDLFNNIIQSSFKGNIISSLVQLIYLFSISVLFFVISLYLMKMAYYRGWFMSSSSKGIFVKSLKLQIPEFAAVLQKFIYPHQYAVIVKDIKCMLRDISTWKNILFPLMLFMLYFKKYNLSSSYTTYIIFLSLFCFWITTAFSFNSTQSEGLSFYLILASPISPSNFLKSKVISCLIIVYTLVFIINTSIGFYVHFSILNILLINLLLLILVVLNGSIATYYGYKYVDFTGDKAMVKIQGGLLFLVVYLGYFIAIGLPTGISIYIIFSSEIDSLVSTNFYWIRIVISVLIMIIPVLFFIKAINKPFKKINSIHI